MYCESVQKEKAKLCFSSGSYALFTGLASTLLKKKNFKTRSTVLFTNLKKKIATVFLVFSKINGIQTNSNSQLLGK